MRWLQKRGAETVEVPCRRLHRLATGEPANFQPVDARPKLWRVCVPISVWLIDHPDVGIPRSVRTRSYALDTKLDPGTHLWWVGTMGYAWGYGHYIAAESVLQVLDGKHRSGCVLVVIEDLDGPPSIPGDGLEPMPDETVAMYLKSQNLRFRNWM